MILNLALGHIDGVTRAYGRRVEVTGGEAEWLLVLPKDTVVTEAQAKSLVAEFFGAVMTCVQFKPAPPALAALPEPPAEPNET